MLVLVGRRMPVVGLARLGAGTALRTALSTALRMGHNYIGTEHLLLGILAADGGDGPGLAGLGLTAARAEQALAGEFARIQAQRRVSG
jgi:ATP-dependent Clp protease ATP-binding subunit ClpA